MEAFRHIKSKWERDHKSEDWTTYSHDGYTLGELAGLAGTPIDYNNLGGGRGEFGLEDVEYGLRSGIEGEAQSVLEEAAQRIYDAAEAEADRLETVLQEITDRLNDGVNSAASMLQEALKPIMKELGEKVKTTGELLDEAIKDAAKALNDGVIAAAKAVDAKLTAAVTSFTTAANNVIGAVLAIADRLAAGINVVVQVNTPDPVTPVVVEPPDTDEEEIDDDTGFPRYPGRAYGGHVKAGRPYTVGEYGREVFVPRVDGDLIPSYNAASPVGRDAEGGGTAVNLNINVESSNDPDLVVQAVRDAFEDNAGHLRDLLQEGV